MRTSVRERSVDGVGRRAFPGNVIPPAGGDTATVSTQVPIRVWNYGLATFDRTHILKINYQWDVPKLPTSNRMLDRLVNHWQLSGITSFISGQPLAVNFSNTVAVDITGSPTDGPRIVVLSDPVLPKSERTFSRFFRTDVFRSQARGTIGNAATLFRGPGVNNFDIAIFKDFPIREVVKLQFRAEMYNAFNHTQFNSVDNAARFDPQGNRVNTRFGEMTGANPPRRIQTRAPALFLIVGQDGIRRADRAALFSDNKPATIIEVPEGAPR